MSRTARTVAFTCWLLFAGNLIFGVAVAGLSVSADQIGWLFILAGYLLVSMILLPATLAILHRASFNNWWVWTLLIGLWVLGGTLGPSSTQPVGISLLGNLIFLSSWVALFVGISILLFRRDIALFLLGLLLLALVWTATLGWLIQGDLIARLLDSLQGKTGADGPIFWVAVLFSTMVCLVPITAIGFLLHTIYAIKREIQGDTLPVVTVVTENASYHSE